MESLLGTSPKLTLHRHALTATASPGRFFAANELKAMLAYIVLNYDVELPEDKQVSDPLEVDQWSPILFRRRKIYVC